MENNHSLTWRVTPDLIAVLNREGIFEETNPAWFATLGLKPDEIESKPFTSFLHPDDIKKSNAAFARIQRGQPVLKFENRYLHKDGTYRWLSWNAVPEGDKFLCIARDITADVGNATSLRARDEEARQRERFIAVLGHDLRNPLSAIGAAIRLLRTEATSERATMLLDSSQESVVRMASLIDALMDFARSQLGSGIAINLVDDAPIGDAIRHVISELELARPEASIELEDQLAMPVTCDPKRIAQLTSNLIANALNHGDAMKPVRIRLTSDEDTFTISVRNFGHAIPAGKLEEIFLPFVRESDDGKGLGLGLFISSAIAKEHGGNVTASSDANATEFKFSMPRTDLQTRNEGTARAIG